MAAFVGREQDMETVGRYFQDAAQGKGSVVFITGEAGIGKTTFINEFKARYVDAQNTASKNKKTPDIRFAEAKCSELIGKGEAYAPFIELIGRLVAEDKAFGSSKLADVVREIGADWFELVPVIGKALKLVSATFFKWQSADDARQLADRKGNKEKLVQQYVQMLKTMSEKHPLVLFVDDLHWADDSSIYLLFQLAREIQDRRILLLGTYRPTDIQAVRGEKAHPLKDALGEMHRFGVCKEVKLGYFTSDHIRRYLDAAFPQNRFDAEFVAYLRDLTEGNPLFVTEQVKLLQEIGKIVQTSQVWELRGTLRDADMPIPTSVEKTIEKRFERLKEDMQETLQYASVSGEQFDAAVVAQMLQQDELAVLKKLQTLDRVYEFVREQKTTPFDPSTSSGQADQGTADALVERSDALSLPKGRNARGAIYQFIHSLVQKSLYGTLSDGIKVKLHAKAAEIIETLYPEQREAFAEELAAHWERGREYANAAPYLLLSARKANRQSGYQEAKTHAQRGLEMLKSANAKTSDQAMLRLQIELLLELAAAEEAIGEAQNSIEHAETASKLAEVVNEQSFQGEVLYRVAKLLWLNKATTNIEWILQILDQALTLKIKAKEYKICGKFLETLFELCEALRKSEYFIGRCQEVIKLNENAQQPCLNIQIFYLMGRMFYHQGNHQEAYELAANGLKLALSEGDQNFQIILLLRLVEYSIKSHNFSKALEHYEQAKIIVKNVEFSDRTVEILRQLGRIAWSMNKHDESLEYLRSAKELAHNQGDLSTEGSILATLRFLTRLIGKFDESLKYGIERLRLSEKLGWISQHLEALDGLGYILRHQGEHIKALELRQQTIALARKYEREKDIAYYLIISSTELRMMGRFKEAIEAVSQALHIFQKIRHVDWEVHSLMILAIFHFLVGHVNEAIAFINQAILLNQTTRTKRVSIHLDMRYSLVLLGTGRYKEAYEILEKATDEWEEREERGEDLDEHFLNSSLIYLAFDEPDKAFERLCHVEEYYKNNIFMEVTAMIKDAYAQVYLAQGDLAKAESSLNEAIALFQQMHSYRLGEADLTLAALRLAQGQPSAALEAASAARNIFTDIEYYRAGEAILWQAKALFALRRFPDAQTRLKESAAEFKRLQQPHHLAEAQLLHGQMLAAAGQNDKALPIMLKAKNTFAKLGLKRLENEAERLINTP